MLGFSLLIEDKSNNKGGDLEDVVEEDGNCGLDAECLKCWHFGETSYKECKCFTDGCSCDAWTNLSQPMSHSIFEPWEVLLLPFYRTLDDEHVINSYCQDQKGYNFCTDHREPNAQEGDQAHRCKY